MRSVLIGFSLLCILALPTLAADKPNEQFWELLDKRDFKVHVDPWPAKAGQPIKVHATAEVIEDEKFKGTVEYRVVTDEKSKQPWTAMKQVKAASKDDVEFEANSKAPAADKVFIQFKIKQTGAEPLELTDWSIDLQK